MAISIISLPIIYLYCSFFIFSNCNDPAVDLSAATTNFGLDLFHHVRKNSNENVFLSPLSVQIALTLVLQGARGLTTDELRSVLNYNNIPDYKINEELQRVSELFKSTNTKYVLNVANRLFLQSGLTIKSPFQSAIQTYYDGAFDAVDFHGNPTNAENRINTWVSDQTKGKISNAVSDIDPATLLIIVNAIYFKGEWVTKFDKEKTKEELFQTISNPVNVNMMSLKGGVFNYGEDYISQIIELPYVGEDFSMFIILPKYIGALEEIESTLNHQSLLHRIDNMIETEIKLLKLPRIKLEMDYRLTSILKSMGLNSLFSVKSDLSGIYGEPGDIKVSEVIHKTFLEINEEGSEAAGATIIMMDRMASLDIFFIANRPFIFFIRDNRSNMILFLGRIINPTQ